MWDVCAKRDFSGVKRCVLEMQLHCRRQPWWFTRNPQGVAMTCSTHFAYLLHIRIATTVRENTKFNEKFFILYHTAITTKSEALS